jgi:hypothetical protein
MEIAPKRISNFERPGGFDIAPGSALDRAEGMRCL